MWKRKHTHHGDVDTLVAFLVDTHSEAALEDAVKPHLNTHMHHDFAEDRLILRFKLIQRLLRLVTTSGTARCTPAR